MYKVQLIISCCLLFISIQSQGQSSKFESTEGKFKISFPTDPERNIQIGETEYGEITIISFICKPSNDDNLQYSVNYLDYPESVIDTLADSNIYSLFDGSQITNFNTSSTELLGVFNEDVLGYKGREYRWQDYNSKTFSRNRFFLVGYRMYIISVTTDIDNNFNTGISNFLNSFELIQTDSNLKKGNAKKNSSSDLNSYKISFPKQTKTRDMETPTDYGTANMKMIGCQPKLQNDDNYGYILKIIEYSKDITKTKKFSLNSYYDNVINFELKSRQSTIISREIITKNGVIGIEVIESFKNGEILIKYQNFLKENKEYSIMVMTIPSNDNNKAMNDFFDSFEFTR
ncbi:MAG: hypothetical protein RJQ09_20840 [Cyclobacteriaceae bacterium]